MQAVVLLTAASLLSAGMLSASASSKSRPLDVGSKLSRSSVRLPLVFEPNHGQAPADVQFLTRTPQGTVQLRADGATLHAPGGHERVAMRFNGARRLNFSGQSRLRSTSNYLRGADSALWQTAIPHFEKVGAFGVYPGIDLVFYGNDGRLEYDFIVSPGAEPSLIQISFDGADLLKQQRNGDLLIRSGKTEFRQTRPRVYQKIQGKEVLVAAGYRMAGRNRVGITLGPYDRSKPLVVDPVIQFASYFGGAGQDSAVAVALDSAGNMFIAGETTSTELATPNAAQRFRALESDAFVAKLTPNGTLIFLTYLGGSKSEIALGLAVDSGGSANVAGVTFSSDLPVKNGAQMNFGGESDGFAARLSPDGSQLLWCSYFGGSRADWLSGLAVDSRGAAWVTGWTLSPNLPVQNAWQGGYAGGGGDTFIAAFDPAGAALLYASYFGGPGRDLGSGIAVSAEGNVLVTGATNGDGFPLVRATQSRPGGGMDAFAIVLNPRRNELLLSTLIGGSGEDWGIRVASDPAGNAYIAGYTDSLNFPATRGAVQTSFGGQTDIFVAKFSPNGESRYATYLGGVGDDWAGDITVDAAGTAYVSGWTNSSNFPSRNPAQTRYAGGDNSLTRYDGVVARLSPDGDALLYASYLGGTGEDKAYGVTLDRSGRLLVAGTTTSRNFPGAINEFSGGVTSNTDVFVAQLSADSAISLLAAQPGAINVTVRAGAVDTPSVSVALTSTGGPLGFSAGSSNSWLRVGAETGTTPRTLNVSINTANLPAGVSTGEIAVVTQFQTLRIPVSVTAVFAAAVASVEPPALTRGSGDVTITITGAGFTALSTAEINGASLRTTLVDSHTLRAVVPAELIRQGGLRLAVRNPEGLSDAFTLPVNAEGPVISASSILSSATRSPGPVAPGQLIVITGTGFGSELAVGGTADGQGRFGTLLGEVRVLFDDVPAPVFSVRSGQISTAVPYSVSGRTTTVVTVEWRAQRSAPISLAVQPAAPGLYTADGSGRGQVAAYNGDGTANNRDNPAARGSLLVLYGTGEGLLSPPTPEGTLVSGEIPRPVQPVTVLIGSSSAAVEYAGSVPGQVTGLIQLNVRVPEGAPAGDTVPVVLSVGGVSSLVGGVTLAIR